MDRREVSLCEGALDGVRVGFERLQKKGVEQLFTTQPPLTWWAVRDSNAGPIG